MNNRNQPCLVHPIPPGSVSRLAKVVVAGRVHGGDPRNPMEDNHPMRQQLCEILGLDFDRLRGFVIIDHDLDQYQIEPGDVAFVDTSRTDIEDGDLVCIENREDFLIGEFHAGSVNGIPITPRGFRLVGPIITCMKKVSRYGTTTKPR